MATKALTKPGFGFPSVFDDFFKPWNEWFDDGGLRGKMMTMPAVNITENKDNYTVSLAAPGLTKDDFTINVDGNMLTIGCEKEDRTEDENERYTRKEYSYSSFSRSFTLPEEVHQEKIEAGYDNGVLRISLPKKEEVLKAAAKTIAVK